MPVAAGYRQLTIAAPGGAVTLPCNRAVAVRAAGPGVVVCTDEDGTAFIVDGRVAARDWRSVVEVVDGVALTAGGEGFRVRVSRG